MINTLLNKIKKQRVIDAVQIDVIPVPQTIGNGNETTVWEKETIKEGPAYKVVHTTKLVKISEFKPIVESEQNIAHDLDALNVKISSEDFQAITQKFEPAEPKANEKPVTYLAPKKEAEAIYPKAKRLPNVIKANPTPTYVPAKIYYPSTGPSASDNARASIDPYQASASNLIPLSAPTYFAGDTKPKPATTGLIGDQPAFDADEAMKQEYLRNRNKPGYLSL